MNVLKGLGLIHCTTGFDPMLDEPRTGYVIHKPTAQKGAAMESQKPAAAVAALPQSALDQHFALLNQASINRQRKEFHTLQAAFARLGYELKPWQFHAIGQTLFDVMRHGQTHTFRHFGDVRAHLASLRQRGG